MATKTTTTKAKTVKPVKEAVKKPAVKTVEKAAAVATVKPASNPEATTYKGRVVVGKVISDKMTQTVVVEVNRLVAHPMYRKRMRKTKHFHADNTIGAKMGDTVEMKEIPPMSKLKYWRVIKIVENKNATA